MIPSCMKKAARLTMLTGSVTSSTYEVGAGPRLAIVLAADNNEEDLESTVGLSLTSFIAGATSNLVTSTESNTADAPTKEMRITLPAGFGMAPSGVTTCGAAEVAAASCAGASQLGTITISSALSFSPIEGSIRMGGPQGSSTGSAGKG